MATTNTDKISRKIGEAFRALRRQGYIARRGFLCCGSCAGHAIASELSAKIDAGELNIIYKTRGAIFYSRQGSEGLRNTGTVCISFGSVDCHTQTCGEQTVGRDTVVVGRELAQALRAAGLAVEWNGSAGRCVEVTGLALACRFDTLAVDLDEVAAAAAVC